MPDKILFPFGGPVAGNDVLDRNGFLEYLSLQLAQSQNIMLEGPRGTGKTSIAMEIIRNYAANNSYFAFIDLFQVNDIRELAVAMINACLENRSYPEKRSTSGITPMIAGTRTNALNLEKLKYELGSSIITKTDYELLAYGLEIPQQLVSRNDKKMVLVIDEFQNIVRITGKDLFKEICSRHRPSSQISFLLLCSQGNLTRTGLSNDGPNFNRFVKTLDLPVIPETTWLSYIKMKFGEKNLETGDNPVRYILQLTGGHPQDTMQVCSNAYYALLEAKLNKLTVESIRIGFEKTMRELEPYFTELIEEAGKNSRSRQVLRCIASGGRIYSNLNGNPNEVKRAIDLLIEKNLICKTGWGTYTYTEPMFREFVLRKLG